MEIVAEEWKAVEGHEGYYEVSSLARVRSVDRIIVYSDGRTYRYPGRLIGQRVDSLGRYLMVCLNINRRVSCLRVHRMVATAFCHKPDGCTEVNHKNGQKHDNLPSNLEWTTPLGNIRHAIETGLSNPAGDAHHNTKVTRAIARSMIAEYGRGGKSQLAIAREFGVAQATVSRAMKRIAQAQKE